MYLKRLILSLALLCLPTGATSQPQCAFLIPALLKSGEMASGCLEVKRHLEPVNVVINLEVNGVNYTVFSEEVPAENKLMCPEFQVPDVSEAVPGFLTIYAVATNFVYNEPRTLMVAPTGKATLIQLERTIYKPGQTVRCSVIATDNNLYMTDDVYPKIYVTDPNGNRIFEWLNQETVNGFYLLSFDILEEPVYGIYTITVERKTLGQVTKTFHVKEYVLTNVVVELSAPDTIDAFQRTLPYRITATYTHGQGVSGKVTGKLCKPNDYSPKEISACNRKPGPCILINGELDFDGSFSGELELDSLELGIGRHMGPTLQITVTVADSGLQVTESKTFMLTTQSVTALFNRPYMQPYYKKGIHYYVEAFVQDQLGNPLSDKNIKLEVNGKNVQNLTTGADGIAWDYIDTSEFEESTVLIKMTYEHPEQCYDYNHRPAFYYGDEYTVKRFYSRSRSFVHIEGPKNELQCRQTYNLTAQYIFSQSGLQEGETTASFSYMVISRAKIVKFGKIPVDLTNSLQGKFNIQVEICLDHVPVMDVVVYYMLKDEVMLDTIRLNTEKCFRNQVSLKFSKESGEPGSTVNMDITSDSRSLCAVRVYDSSLLLLHKDEPLTPAMVYAALQYNSLNGYNIAGHNVAPPDPPCVNNRQIFSNGYYYSLIEYPNEGDNMQKLKSIGLNLVTNTTLGKPKLCYPNTHPNSGVTYTAIIRAIDEDTIESYRTSFPEMWFFGHTDISGVGSVSVPLQVPGTITKWRSDMVCLSYESGFGMTKYPANFTSFQEFFVEVYLSYSCVQGEIMIVKVVVFNHLKKCVKVNTTVEPSQHYAVEPMDEGCIKCICSRERASYSFKIGAKSLGVVKITVTSETVHIGDTCEGPADPNQPSRKDTVVQEIIVEVIQIFTISDTIESYRTSFPEMWFFGHTDISGVGSLSVPLQVPGTITKWRSDMVCLSYESGFGMTKYPANFTSFQEFFVEVYLSYSCVQGEIMIVKVVVFNHLKKCVKVNTTVEPSQHYTVEPMDEGCIKCICSRERASYSFKIGAKSLGVVKITVTSETVHIGDTCEGPADPNQPSRKDTVVREIIVEPEGIRHEVTKSLYVCVKGTESVTLINITPPENTVKNSVKAKIHVIGDILGRALINPESLIREPTGCGEQNLATLMIIPVVVDYLNKTGRLLEETKSKAVQLMGNGYRNQLRFRNQDGSFSAFEGKQGSAWLTVLTLDTLQRIKPNTFVDTTVLNQAALFVEGLKDKVTGAFKPKGTLFNDALKGGAEDDVSFTAIATVVFLQGRYAFNPTLLRDAMNFLDAASRKEQTIYNIALLFYCFRMAGNEERSKAMFEKLKELQIEEGGTIHWERPEKPNTKTSYIFSPRAASAEVEITGYVLCGLTTGQFPPPADLAYMSQIALWLCQQQNSHGSYSTTADTMVALQAMSGYGALVYQEDAMNDVQIKYGDQLVKEFLLGIGSRYLLHSQVLPYIPGNYSVTVNGNGCVLVQTTVDFNIPVNDEDSAFRLSVHTPPESCVDGVATTFPVFMNVSYNGLRNQSNMALLQVALPSGYTIQHQSLVQLRYLVAKVEIKNNVIIIYLEKVSRDVINLHMTLEMSARVLNFQPKYVLAWDYYEKEENGKAVLLHPCAKQ